MSWRDFERAMAGAFAGQGYQVTITPDGADGGVDLVLHKHGERVLVQCKHWAAWKVGVKTVRELFGVMNLQDATAGIVATSGRFSAEARQFAGAAGITLLGRTEVVAMLGAAPSRFTATPSGGVGLQMGGPRCPRCGESMALRIAGRGQTRGQQFWGCPRYPACRGIRPIVQANSPFGAAPPRPQPHVPQAKAGDRAARRILVGALVLLATMLLVPLVLAGGYAVLMGAIVSAWSAPTSGTYPTSTAKSTRSSPSRAADSRILDSIRVPVAPNKVAVDAELRRLYVTALESKSLVIIDLASGVVLSTVPLDRQPGEVAVDPTLHQVWITNYNDATVTVLDREGKLLVVVPVGQGPAGVAIDPGLHRAYVANRLDKTVSSVDSVTHRVTTTSKVAGAYGAAAVDTVSHQVCFVTEWMDIPYCYDSSWSLLGYLKATGSSISIDSVTHSHFATGPGSSLLSVADGVTGKKSTVPVGATPMGVAVDPTTHLVYVTDHDSATVLVIKPL